MPVRPVILACSLCLTVAPVLAQIAAPEMSGVFSGRFQGQPARASLAAEEGRITGTLDVDGYVYRLAAEQTGRVARGQLTDMEGLTLPLILQLDDSRLSFRVFAPDAETMVLEFALSRGGGADSGASESGAAAGANEQATTPGMAIDPVLVGRWVKSSSYTSGDFSVASETSITLFRDGTYQQGPSRVVGGGDAGSFDSGGGGDGPGGRWGAANRIVYTLHDGGWAPYARYYVEGDTLMLTFGDGSREIWTRR